MQKYSTREELEVFILMTANASENPFCNAQLSVYSIPSSYEAQS